MRAFFKKRIFLSLKKLSQSSSHLQQEAGMELSEYTRKLEELDRLFDDPDMPLEPARLWRLLGELARHDLEVRAGIEPAYTDLQSAASPLCHRTL